MKRVFALLFLFASIFLFVACPSPTGPESAGVTTTPKTCTVVSSSWYSSTIDSTYWTGPNANPESVYLTFNVTYAEDLVRADIESIKVTNPLGGAWDYNNSDLILDEAGKSITMQNLWENFGDYKTKHCLGDWTIVITLANGTTTKTTITVTEPGSLIKPIKTFLVVGPVVDTNEVLTLAKPSISLATRTTDKISVTCKVNDPLVYNAFIWFYDVNNEYIGTSGYLREKNGDASSLVKDAMFNNDGEMTIEISNVIALQSKFTQEQYDSIDNCIVIVTDGKQYAPLNRDYDHRRFSIRTVVK